MQKNNIFVKSKHEDPYYKKFDKYVHAVYNSFWTPAKYEQLIEREVDEVRRMDKIDQETIERAILAIAMVEDKVKTFWSTIALDFPQTILGDVGGEFAHTEVVHRRSYASLMNNLKITPESINNHPVLTDRIEYLTKYLKFSNNQEKNTFSSFIKSNLCKYNYFYKFFNCEKEEEAKEQLRRKKIVKKLTLFTALVEKCSLFTQFYILMSYAKGNKGLKSISSLQQSTAQEENMHYSFGIDIINVIKEQTPELWDNYVIELINKNLMMAYNSELDLIHWIFESGVPSHITKEEIINFLNYNFNTVSNDLGLDLTFNFDEKLFSEKNEWFVVKTVSPIEPDFFVNAVGNYSSTDESINIDNITINLNKYE